MLRLGPNIAGESMAQHHGIGKGKGEAGCSRPSPGIPVAVSSKRPLPLGNLDEAALVKFHDSDGYHGIGEIKRTVEQIPAGASVDRGCDEEIVERRVD